MWGLGCLVSQSNLYVSVCLCLPVCLAYWNIVTAQLNLNSRWEWQSNGLAHTTTETFKALPGNLGNWFSICNLILTQLDDIWKTTSIFLKMEDDLNFFSNGRRPHFCSRQTRKLVLGMQPYLDPTRWNMEDDLIFFHIDDDLIFFQIEDDLKGADFWSETLFQSN
jgi:hypothetical protein